MEISKIITDLLCGISPFVIGWLILSLLVGIRGGSEAGLRLFLLGLGLLSILVTVVAILLFSPDWAATVLILVFGFMPWVATLRYFVAIKTSGKLLMALPFQQDTWRTSILSGAWSLVFGLYVLTSARDFLTPAKDYAIGIALISLGLFKTIQRIRVTQIRKKGILYLSGNFYKWGNIENYTWKLGEDKLTLKLKKYTFKQTVNLKILSHFRYDASPYLSQNIENVRSGIDEHLPFQGVG